MKDVVHTIILIITNPFRKYVKTEEIMALLELPGKAPSLKLILSLLEQTSDVAVAAGAFRLQGAQHLSDPN